MAKAVLQRSHIVDTWIEGSQAQEMNTQRIDFNKNLHVMVSHKKYSKSRVECLKALVHQLVLDQLGYSINREGLKVVNVILDALSNTSYEMTLQFYKGRRI